MMAMTRVCKVLALYILHSNIWEASAFIVQPTKFHTPWALNARRSRRPKRPRKAPIKNEENEVVVENAQREVQERVPDVVLEKKKVDTSSRTDQKYVRFKERNNRSPSTMADFLNTMAGTDENPLSRLAKQGTAPIVLNNARRLEPKVIEKVSLEKEISEPKLSKLEVPKKEVSTLVEEETKEAAKDILQKMKTSIVQGGSLRTFQLDEDVERVEVMMTTEGRPLESELELWQGPDNAPQKVIIYVDDGSMRPFRAFIETPGNTNNISIRNRSHIEFPLVAGVDVHMEDKLGKVSVGPAEMLYDSSTPFPVQGDSIYSSTFPPNVESVQILLKTDGRPLYARVELIQGPNNNRQVMDIYCEDGKQRPFYAVISTPGNESVVRIINAATTEFPFTACLEPYQVIVDSEGKTSSSKKPLITWM